jgi:hypothetical protein
VVHEDRVVHRLDHARLLCRPGQALVVRLHLLAQQQTLPALHLRFFIRQFLPSRLHGKIGLPQRDERLARVRVLDGEITGVAGKPPIFDRTLRA